MLLLDPDISDAAVFSVRDTAGIEEIWAAVVSASPIDAQAIASRAQPMLHEKLPSRILQVETIPRNQNGKITRNALREQLIARLSQ